MNRRVVTAALALLAAGLVLWPIPYGHVEMLSGGFLSVWLAPAAVVGVVGTAVSPSSSRSPPAWDSRGARGRRRRTRRPPWCAL